MKFDDITSILLIVCVFVPGFIFDTSLSNFSPRRENKSKELLLIRLLTASILNYVACIPIIYVLLYSDFFSEHHFISVVISSILWFFVIFCMPVILALIAAYALQKKVICRLANKFNLPYVSHILTGWDYKFGNIEACYLLITLKDGTQIAGYFGVNSLSSSILEHKDIYLEETYILSEEKIWIQTNNTYGLWVSGEQIAFIEFLLNRSVS